MAVDKFFHDREPFHPNHPGMHSHQTREAEASNQVRECVDVVLYDWETYRKERMLSHEAGHTHIGNQELGHLVGDQWTPAQHVELEAVRQELKAMCE